MSIPSIDTDNTIRRGNAAASAQARGLSFQFAPTRPQTSPADQVSQLDSVQLGQDEPPPNANQVSNPDHLRALAANFVNGVGSSSSSSTQSNAAARNFTPISTDFNAPTRTQDVAGLAGSPTATPTSPTPTLSPSSAVQPIGQTSPNTQLAMNVSRANAWAPLPV